MTDIHDGNKRHISLYVPCSPAMLVLFDPLELNGLPGASWNVCFMSMVHQIALVFLGIQNANKVQRKYLSLRVGLPYSPPSGVFPS